MTTLKFLFTTLLFTAVFSCQNKPIDSVFTEVEDSDDDDTTELTNQTIDPFQPNATEKTDAGSGINFNELSVTVSQSVLWDEGNDLSKIHLDTAILYLEIGGTIEGQVIKIETDKLDNLKVEQRYETTLTVMSEGKHCDLTRWKHYYSEWIPLAKNNKGDFIGAEYTESEAERFPPMDINELKSAVKDKCGAAWYNAIKDIGSPTDYPCSVVISRYFLKVTGQRKQSGGQVTKYLIFE